MCFDFITCTQILTFKAINEPKCRVHEGRSLRIAQNLPGNRVGLPDFLFTHILLLPIFNAYILKGVARRNFFIKLSPGNISLSTPKIIKIPPVVFDSGRHFVIFTVGLTKFGNRYRGCLEQSLSLAWANLSINMIYMLICSGPDWF